MIRALVGLVIAAVGALLIGALVREVTSHLSILTATIGG